MRQATVTRKTRETDIAVTVNLDGSGAAEIATGVGFLDHMIEQLARHGLIDLAVAAKGDLHIDQHHTTEDVGIVIGQALSKALGDRAGIARYADVHLPMDETLTRCAVDVSGRPYLVWRVEFSRSKIGEFDTELVPRILPGAGAECRNHPACRDALRPQQPPHRRDLLQGGGAGAPLRRRDRSAPGGARSFDQGQPHRIGCETS